MVALAAYSTVRLWSAEILFDRWIFYRCSSKRLFQMVSFSFFVLCLRFCCGPLKGGFRNIPLVTIAFMWATFVRTIITITTIFGLSTNSQFIVIIGLPQATYESLFCCHRRAAPNRPCTLRSPCRAVVIVPFPVVQLPLSCTRLTPVAFSYSWLPLYHSYHVW